MENSKSTIAGAIDGYLNSADEYARREPTKAVVSAFGIGVLLNMLPLAAIAASLVRAATLLVRPGLLFLGLIKAAEYCGATQDLFHPSQNGGGAESATPEPQREEADIV